MAKIYQIKNTAGDRSITILPQGVNGANKSVADSDINLVGQGATLWGDDLNESLYRMVENFACPPKAGSPALSRLPQDEGDLGTGQGINNPVPGQLWFNTDTQKVYVYSDTAEKFESITNLVAGPTEPTDSPSVGDLWYDTSLPQLKVYDGAAWTSTAERYLLLSGASTMTGDLDLGGNSVVNVADVAAGSPVFGQHAANVNYVNALQTSLEGGLLDPLYVEIAGDTMTGDLTMTNSARLFIEDGTAANPSLVFRTDFVQDTGLFTQGDGYINFTTNGVEKAKIEPNGTISVSAALNYETLVTDDDDIPNKKYVDDEITSAAASAMPTGSIVPFAGSVAPAGYLLCDGAAVSRTTYADLFALLNADGLLYGSGDGSTTFNVPDFKGRYPAGVGTTDPVPSNGGGTVVLGQKFGQWYTKLTTVNQLPAHNHGGGSHTHYTARAGAGGLRSYLFSSSYDNEVMHTNQGGTGAAEYHLSGSGGSTADVAPTGGPRSTVIITQGASQAFFTNPPYLGVNFIIKT